MRWSSRVGDLANLLFVVGPHTPDCSLQRLTANLSGSNPYTTSVDVNCDYEGCFVALVEPGPDAAVADVMQHRAWVRRW